MIEKINIISKNQSSLNTGSRLSLKRDRNFNHHLRHCNFLCLMFSAQCKKCKKYVSGNDVMVGGWLVLVGVPPADMGRLRTWSGGRRRAKRRRANVKTTIKFNKQENRKIDKYRTEKYENKIKTKNWPGKRRGGSTFASRQKWEP